MYVEKMCLALCVGLWACVAPFLLTVQAEKSDVMNSLIYAQSGRKLNHRPSFNGQDLFVDKFNGGFDDVSHNDVETQADESSQVS